MKHLEESNKEAKEDAEMDAEIELEMSRAVTPVCPVIPPILDGKAIGGAQVSIKKELPVLLKQARVRLHVMYAPVFLRGAVV